MKNNTRKIIGFIGGVGPQSTNYIYKKIISLAQKMHGAKNNDDFPEMLIHSNPIPDFITSESNIPTATNMLFDGVKLLENTGCTALAIGSNTVHILLNTLQEKTKIPFISMIQLVAKKCDVKKYKKVALLGSPVLMKSKIYDSELRKRGIEQIIPEDSEFEILDHMIRSVLAGKKEHEMKDRYVMLMNRLYAAGAEAIILGCTELPLAINYEALGDKTINSDEVLAEGLVDYYYQ